MSSTQYGIGVTKNRFELFDSEDEDPVEMLKNRELEKGEKKKAKGSEKENKVKEPVEKPKLVAAQRKGITETQNVKPLERGKLKEEMIGAPAKTERKLNPSEFRDSFNNRRNREDFNNRRNWEERPTSDFRNRDDRGERFDRRDGRSDRNYASQYGENVGETRTRGRGAAPSRGPSRGGRGGRGAQRSTFDVRGKREYDRQSGSDKTGVKHVDKREGAGSHNWGNLKDDIAEMRNSPGNDETAWTSEKPEETSAQVNGRSGNEGDDAVNAADDQLRELTLDEWKALKAPRQKPKYNIRKPGEGEDQSQWKQMFAYKKKKERTEEEDYDEEEEEGSDNHQRVGKQRQVLNINIHFKDTRGATKGRGAGRGGMRPPVRGPPDFAEFTPVYDSPSKIVPKVDDEHDFPSLG